jgi:hypothetical protein
VHFHFGWLRCTPEKFFEEVQSADFILDPDDSAPLVDDELVGESWGMSELLRAAWHLSRSDAKFKELVWEEIASGEIGGKTKTQSRLNRLRAPVSFTASRSNDEGVDILQEYFVPLARLSAMVEKLRLIFRTGEGVNVLSSTIRHVKADKLCNLSYCPNGEYASIAVDAHVGVTTTNGIRVIDGRAKTWINQATEAAIALGGSYYLPYYKVADVDMFKAAYAPADIQKQRAAIQKFNPQKKFWNSFLETYLSQA